MLLKKDYDAECSIDIDNNNKERSSVSLLNSFMIEALCFNTSNGINCSSDSFSIDRDILKQQKKERILNFSQISNTKSSNKKKFSSNNLLAQVDSIINYEIAQRKSIQINKYEERLQEISSIPYKILDAPNIVDNYYYNVLDWGSRDILAVCLGPTVYLWNNQTETTDQLYKDENNIASVSWMPNGVCLAVGLSDGTCDLYDTEKMIRIRKMDGHKEGTRVSSLSWNNCLISTGGKDSMILNHDVRARYHIADVLKGHSKEVCALQWSKDGEFLASGSNDNTVCIWEVNTNLTDRVLTRMNLDLEENDTYQIYQPKYCLTQHNSAVKGIAWCPYQRNILVTGGGTGDKTIKIWNSDNGSLIKSVDTGCQICGVLFNKYEKELITSHGFSKNQVCIWNFPKMTKVKELTGHMNRVLYMAMSHDGCTIVTGSPDETLRFWTINDREKVNELNGNKRSSFSQSTKKPKNSINGEMNLR